MFVILGPKQILVDDIVQVVLCKSNTVMNVQFCDGSLLLDHAPQNPNVEKKIMAQTIGERIRRDWCSQDSAWEDVPSDCFMCWYRCACCSWLCRVGKCPLSQMVEKALLPFFSVMARLCNHITNSFLVKQCKQCADWRKAFWHPNRTVGWIGFKYSQRRRQSSVHGFVCTGAHPEILGSRTRPGWDDNTLG